MLRLQQVTLRLQQVTLWLQQVTLWQATEGEQGAHSERRQDPWLIETESQQQLASQLQ